MRGPHGVSLKGGVVAAVIASFALAGLPPPGRAADAFTVAGQVDGLYPGAAMALDALVTNPHPFAIRVTSIAVRVDDASAGCPGSVLEVGGSEVSVVVAGGGTADIPLVIRMDVSASDACQGVTWPLAFSATAVGPPTDGLPGTSIIDARRYPQLAAIGAGLSIAALAMWMIGSRRRRLGAT
ncbi:MAG: hypothetical protein ACRDFY_07400 [Candidatus Limnocylindria bacterium]